MRETLTLFEYELLSVNLTTHELMLLDHLQQKMPEKVLQPVYRAGSWSIRAGQHVGVVRLGQKTIQILPKIYQSPEAALPVIRAQEATANLLHMLDYAGLVQVRESDITNLLSRDSDWFEVLTYLFASHLREEWRRGPARKYQSIEDDLPLLKGKWRLNTQLQRPDRAHRFTVVYDEFTVDIALNRIFRFVVEQLYRLTDSGVNIRILGELRGLLDEVTLVPAVTVEDAERIAFNRLNLRYQPLLNLARLFLDKGALQMASGDSSLFAFVFDMNVVFESFIAGFVKRHRPDAIPHALQSCTLVMQAHNSQLYLARSDNKSFFRLKPDLLFCQKDATILIIDTKYKCLDPADRKLGVSEADFYQMFAYARRYDCSRVILLYPQTVQITESVRRCFQLENSNHKQICVATIDIRRDLGKYQERAALAAELAAILS